MIKTISSFVDKKFEKELKEAVLTEENLNDPIVQIGVKMYITELLSKTKVR